MVKLKAAERHERNRNRRSDLGGGGTVTRCPRGQRLSAHARPIVPSLSQVSSARPWSLLHVSVVNAVNRTPKERVSPEQKLSKQENWRNSSSVNLSHCSPAGAAGGQGASGLDDSGLVQGMLFDGEGREKRSRVDAVADEIIGAVWGSGDRRVGRSGESSWMVARNGRRARLPGQTASGGRAISAWVCIESQAGVKLPAGQEKPTDFLNFWGRPCGFDAADGGDECR